MTEEDQPMGDSTDEERREHGDDPGTRPGR
jgi:hypothetical protein